MIKRNIPGLEVFITLTLEEVEAIMNAGADIVALDVTDRERRLEQANNLIEHVHQGGLVMADVSTYEEGVAAELLGADFIGTTLSGYTSYSPRLAGPDFEQIRRLSGYVNAPVIAEGRIWTPEEAVEALKAGASHGVVGSAITRPQLIAARYVEVITQKNRVDRGNKNEYQERQIH